MTFVIFSEIEGSFGKITDPIDIYYFEEFEDSVGKIPYPTDIRYFLRI